MKLSTRFRRIAINNTWPSFLLAALWVGVTIELRCLGLPPMTRFVDMLVGLALGWSCALWFALAIVRVGENNPELLDDLNL